MIGIYKITNKINGKVYIGQSLDIEYRWKRHLWASDNCAIHLAMRKYGNNNFSFEVLEECDKSILNEREQYWITYYNSIVPNGYNMTQGGSGSLRRKVQCFDEQGQFVKEYSSIIEAAQENNINPAKIVSCCRDSSRYFVGNYQWKYSEDDRKITPKKKQTSHTIYQFDKNGLLLNKYSSITEAARVNNCDKSKICACCNGRQKTAYGYQWSYKNTCDQVDNKNRPRQVGQYSLSGELIATFPTITKAAKAVGGTAGGVGAVCTGHSKTCKGYIFKYID